MFGLGWRNYLEVETNEADLKKRTEDGSAMVMDDKLKAMRTAWEEATAQISTDGQIAAMKKVLDASAEAFWTIGISRPGLGYQPTSKALQGLPENSLDGWLPGTHKILRPEQWFLQA
jgi:hypothetical protein